MYVNIYTIYNRKRTVQVIFSSMFSLSCTLFMLVIFEIMAVMDPWSRWIYWRLSLYLVLLGLTVVCPMYTFYLFLDIVNFKLSQQDNNSVKNLKGKCLVYMNNNVASNEHKCKMHITHTHTHTYTHELSP